jgi:hypothetical protein
MPVTRVRLHAAAAAAAAAAVVVVMVRKSTATSSQQPCVGFLNAYTWISARPIAAGAAQ